MTYAEVYKAAALDPKQVPYAQALERFDPEAYPAISHVMLLEQAICIRVAPQSYLCCTLRCNQVCIFSLNTSLPDIPVLWVTQWDGQCFAFLGEVTQGITMTIAFPENVFQTMMNVRAWMSG